MSQSLFVVFVAANNLLTNKSSLGTVTNLVQPISIHFPAYMIAAEFIDVSRLDANFVVNFFAFSISREDRF
jgi:hypothetical protein